MTRLSFFSPILLPLALCAAALTACQPARQTTAPGELPPLQPARNAAPYRVASSLVIVKVYRAGTMAELGHNHVVSNTSVTGEIYVPPGEAGTVFELRLPVQRFDIDLPEQRAAAGPDFPGELSESAIEGTRDNLLGERQLNAAVWPEIVLRGRAEDSATSETGCAYEADVAIRLRDFVHSTVVPVCVERAAGASNELRVSGRFSVLQTELGMEPFSVMMGALQVRDQLDIDFSLTAVPQ